MAKIDPEHGQLTDEFCIAEERGLIRSKRARTEPAKAYSEIQAEEDAERREASLQRASAKRKALEDAERRRLQEKQRQTIAIQQANRIAMQQQRVNMPIVLTPAQLVASSVKPGARYPVKGETAVCPLCNGLFVLKKPKYCPVEQKWMPSEFRKHTCVSVHAIMPTG